MITSNLATRPFYNERAVRFWLTGVAALVALATIFNVSRTIYYSKSDTELARQATNDETRAADLGADAAELRASVDAKQIEAASIEARQANDLIDRRTFSWTELFNRFEATLPPNVRVTSVQPRIDQDRRIVLTITVRARSVGDVDRFMENLEGVGAFAGLLSREERVNDEGQIEASLETVYVAHPSTGSGQDPLTESGPAPSASSGPDRVAAPEHAPAAGRAEPVSTPAGASR